MNTRLLAITNCLDCPYKKEISDPGSSDSFDSCDTSIVCTKQPGTAKGDSNRHNNPEAFRYISVSERPYRHRGYCNIPDWCPLGTVHVK